ncbi:MAG: GyrI-like domain-containing protein [Methanomicrobiaceae archaeon]|uniref:Bacterial transcription activator, effector binding protein n=1 Tax=hydrocarbon metagenome TaxID=938273 RepID=A0A0W8FGL6_9ZZZZ|nr:GyrI-like domain-containing protein [Methanomicrobiaceae archaeon]
MSTDDVSIVTVPPCLVLGVRRRGRYEEIPQMIMAVCDYAMKHGVELAGPPIFLMHETGAEDAMRADQEGNADMEVAWPIAAAVEDAGEFRCYSLPGGEMAMIVHRGAYHECGRTYERLYAWFAERAIPPGGPIREVYLNDPCEVAESEILTAIYVPLA